MPTPLAAEGSTLPLDDFWGWVKDHPNCILRASTPEAFLYDFEDLHWNLYEEDDKALVAQMLRGKQLVAEIIIDPRDVLYVQAMPEPDHPEQALFEIVSGPKEDAVTVCTFLMAHAYDEETTHSQALKH